MIVDCRLSAHPALIGRGIKYYESTTPLRPNYYKHWVLRRHSRPRTMLRTRRHTQRVENGEGSRAHGPDRERPVVPGVSHALNGNAHADPQRRAGNQRIAIGGVRP